MLVQLQVSLEIDAQTKEECEQILNDMSYYFSSRDYISGLNSNEEDKIINQEIRDWIIL